MKGMIYLIGLIGCYISYLLLGFAPVSPYRKTTLIKEDGTIGPNNNRAIDTRNNEGNTFQESRRYILKYRNQSNRPSTLLATPEEYNIPWNESDNSSLGTNIHSESRIPIMQLQNTNNIMENSNNNNSSNSSNNSNTNNYSSNSSNISNSKTIHHGVGHTYAVAQKEITEYKSTEIQQYKHAMTAHNRIGALLISIEQLWIFESYFSLVQNTGGYGDIVFMDGLYSISKDSLLVELFLGILIILMLFTMGSPITKGMTENVPPYSLMIITNILGLIYFLNSNDWVVTITAWELMNLSLYLLVTMQGNTSTSSGLSAGLKYFLLSALTTAFLLMGIGLIYSQTGSTSYDVLISFFHTRMGMDECADTCMYIASQPGAAVEANIAIDAIASPIIESTSIDTWSRYYQRSSIGFILIIVTLLFKLGAAPFHNWAPDLYDSLPTPITMYVSLIPKITILLFMIQPIILVISDHTTEALHSVSIFSILIGSIGLISQLRIKRFITYSAISHLGFILMAYVSLSLDSYLYYIFIYGCTNLIFFTIIRAIGDTIKGNYGDLIYIHELGGIFKLNPPIAIAFSLTLFSLAGIPPLGGFFAKLLILQSLCYAYQIYIAIIIILASIIGAVCYLYVLSLVLLDLPIYHVLLMPSIIKRIYAHPYINNSKKSPSPAANHNMLLHTTSSSSNRTTTYNNGLLSIASLPSYFISFLSTFLLFFYLKPSILLSLLSISIFMNLGILFPSYRSVHIYVYCFCCVIFCFLVLLCYLLFLLVFGIGIGMGIPVRPLCPRAHISPEYEPLGHPTHAHRGHRGKPILGGAH